jgi:hypothetical protein
MRRAGQPGHCRSGAGEGPGYVRPDRRITARSGRSTCKTALSRATSVCAEAPFSQFLSTRLVLSGPSAKNISFFFSEIVIVCRHPASLRGALRAIVTTRGAGMRWTFGSRQTNAGRRT